MSGVHGHRLGRAHPRGLPGGLLLRGTSACQVVEGRPTLNQGVQSFLHTRVVKVDTSRAGGSRSTCCNWHAAWWGAITLGSRWRQAWHCLAGWVLGSDRAKGAVGRLLRGSRSTSAHRSPAAAVEQAEDFSLQLLLMVGVGCGAWTSR